MTNKKEITPEDVEEGIQLCLQVWVEKELRHSGFMGVPPRPGSWIPRDPEPEESK